MSARPARPHSRGFAGAYLAIALVLLGVGWLGTGRYEGCIVAPGILLHWETGETLCGFRADTPTRWHWRTPRNYRYDHIRLAVDASWPGSRGADTEAHIDPVAGLCTSDGVARPLSRETLAELLAPGAAPTPQLAAQLDALLDVFDRLGRGTFHPPRHHSITLKPPLHATVSHWGFGGTEPRWAWLAWLAAWPVYLLLSRARAPHPWLTPRKAFALVAGGALGLGLLATGLAVAAGPGAIAKASEAVLGVLALPGLLADGRGDWRPVPQLAGALAWANAASVAIVLNRPRPRIRRGGFPVVVAEREAAARPEEPAAEPDDRQAAQPPAGPRVRGRGRARGST